jgi:hypothetical protein
MQFDDDVVGGITLIRPAIQSPNYVAGTSGWSINVDGSAEFTDLLVRSSDGSGSNISLANGKITITNAADIVVSEISSAGYKLYHPTTGVLLAESTLAGGPNGLPGFQSYDSFTPDLYIYVGDSQLQWGNTEIGMLQNPTVASFGLTTEDDDFVSTIITGGIFSDTGSSPQVRLQSAATGRPRLVIESASVGSDIHCDVEMSGQITTYNDDVFDTYVPSVTGGGAATFTARSGWWTRVGKMIYFQAYFVVGTAGTGTANVLFTGPTGIYRSGARQAVSGGLRDGGVAGAGPMTALAFAGGSGATFDRIVNSAGTDVTGALLTSGSVWTFEGWYRED